MNIFVLIVLALMQEDTSVVLLKEPSREFRRRERDKAIARNKRTAKEICSCMPWFDEPWHNEAHNRLQKPELEGLYISYHKGKVYDKPQQGRWADYHFGGHRRFQKWMKEAYPSDTDVAATQRWKEELKEYLDS